MLGLKINNHLYAWKAHVSEAAIALKKAKEVSNKLVNIITASLVVIGLVAFFLHAASTDLLELFYLDYWVVPSAWLLLFWASIFLLLFLLYRVYGLKKRPKLLPKLMEIPSSTSISESDWKQAKHLESFFDEDAIKAIEEAYKTAKKFKHKLAPIHLFIGALASSDAGVLFGRLGLGFETIKDALIRRLGTMEQSKHPGKMNATGEEILFNATQSALEHKRSQVTAVEIIISAYKKDEFLQELMYSKEIKEEDLYRVVDWIRIHNKLVERYDYFRSRAVHKPKGAMNRAYTAIATPFLDSVSTDLTRAAVKGGVPLLVGREKEMSAMLRAIEGGNQSVVLVGSPGVGKTSMVYGLAERMVEEDVPKILQDKRLVEISLSHIISGADMSQAEGKLLRALQEIGASRNIITIIQDIDQMVTGGLDLSAILSKELEKGYTFVIATTTPQGYVQHVEGSALGQKLTKIDVGEPEIDEAIRVLEAKISGIEYKQKVVFSYAAVSGLITLSDRYIHDKYLPEKAIELAEEVALDVFKQKGENGLVELEDVKRIVGEKTRVPVTNVESDERETLLHMEERLHERVIGQNEAVKAVAAALRRARAELRSQNRPIANFLFLGPTGVGKTELAKTVSEVYFGSEEVMLRFDMSEFQEQRSLERLIGLPGEGGRLTEAVRQNPFSLVLLDELEKAHPDILNLFLQVMDDGRLTDGAGRTIDFTNTIIIATSNAGSNYLQDALREGKPLDQIKSHLMETELDSYFRPEFLNRFDGVILFTPLSLEDVVQIAYLMMNRVKERLEVKGIHLEVSDEAIHELAKKGFDPVYGARPLRRVIQEDVDNAIATELLKGNVGRRDKLILEAGGKIRIEKAPEL